MAATVDETGLGAFVRRAVDLHIRPAHQTFAAEAERLSAATAGLCAAPEEAQLDGARDAFAGAVRAFAALETVRVGPIASDNRRERVDFWPDARGRGLAQLQKILAAADPADLDFTAIAAKSVAVQGLPALEFLLFGSGSDELLAAGSFRCAFARTIAANLAGIGREMAAAWEGEDGAAALLLRPGPGNPLFRDHAEAAGEIVAGMATALEIVAGQKLPAILGSAPGKARPKVAPFWRSGNTFAALAATIEATGHLFAVSGAEALLTPDTRWIAGQVAFETADAIRVLSKLGPDVAAAVTGPEGRDALGYARLVAHELEGTIGRDLAGALGLAQGFNALDGD